MFGISLQVKVPGVSHLDASVPEVPQHPLHRLRDLCEDSAILPQPTKSLKCQLEAAPSRALNPQRLLRVTPRSLSPGSSSACSG